MALTVAACLLLAALSLLGPSEPSYDPWAWLVWGRELALLKLDTTGGPSWKPLPVAFTTVFAPLSALDDGIPAALWMVVARAGGLLALALSFTLSGRIVGGAGGGVASRGRSPWSPSLLTPGWIRYLFHGNEAPLAIGLGLWAVDRHLEGRRGWALVLGGLVCLARPELFLFLGLYALYVWWRAPALRALTAATLTLVPAAWLVPSWVGSGDPLFAGGQARSEPSWSLSLAAVPWRAALGLAQSQTWLVLELGALAALAFALAALRWPRLPRPAHPGAAVALAGFGGSVLLLYAGMTEAGFSGNVRYVLPAPWWRSPCSAAWAWRCCSTPPLESRSPLRASVAVTALAAALLGLAQPALRDHLRTADVETREAIERSRLHTDLERAVDGLGPRYVTYFGPATVNRSYQTHLAWELKLPLGAVHGARGRGLVFKAPAEPVAGVVRVYRRARPRRLLAHVGQWRVSERPPDAGHVFKWPIVGFRLRTAAERLRNPSAASVFQRSAASSPHRSPRPSRRCWRSRLAPSPARTSSY